MVKRYLLFLAALLVAAATLPATAAQPAAAPVAEHVAFLPAVRRSPNCHVPGTAYASLPISGAPTDRPAAVHADLNLALRGWAPVSAPLQLVDYAGMIDPLAPQLDALFTDRRVPAFSATYQVYGWDWGCNCRGDLDDLWPTSLIGMAASFGEVIGAPDSGYNIGGGYDAMVLYATPDSLTLKYTREDNVVAGYTVHIESICVEPDLLARYQANNAAGRSELPVVGGGQALGRAMWGSILVGVRDNGTFLDPRSRKDWWQDH